MKKSSFLNAFGLLFPMLLAPNVFALEKPVKPALKVTVAEKEDTPAAPLNPNMDGTCYSLAKCTGEVQAVKVPAECPADKRWFRINAPGAACEHFFPK